LAYVAKHFALKSSAIGTRVMPISSGGGEFPANYQDKSGVFCFAICGWSYLHHGLEGFGIAPRLTTGPHLHDDITQCPNIVNLGMGALRLALENVSSDKGGAQDRVEGVVDTSASYLAVSISIRNLAGSRLINEDVVRTYCLTRL
jgi:hypothetical protein